MTAYYAKLHMKSYCYLLVIYINNTSQTVTTDENWQHVLFEICTPFTTLHSCYLRIQKSIIFLCLFLQTKGKELIINNIIW